MKGCYIMSDSTTQSYLKRVSIFLEDNEWEKADEYCEKTLDVNPECSEAYVGKILVEFNCSSLEVLFDSGKEFEKSVHYKRIMEFGDEALKERFQNAIPERGYRKAKRQEEIIEQSKKESQFIIETRLKDMYIDIIETYASLEDYKDSEKLKQNSIQNMLLKAEDILQNKLYDTASEFFEYLSRYENVENQIAKCNVGKNELKKVREAYAVRAARKTIAISSYHSVGIKSGGKVIATKDRDPGLCHYLGDLDDGSVGIITCKDKSYERQRRTCERAKRWSDIVAIDANSDYILGLKSDGTVITTSEDYGKRDVRKWEDIIAISAGRYHCVGLKKDGTVVSTKVWDKKNDDGQTKVGGWKDIISVYAYGEITVGLKSDGKVVCNKNVYEDWRDIVAISVDTGLRADGKLLKVSDYSGETRIVEGCWENIIEFVSSVGVVALQNNENSSVISEHGITRLDEWSEVSSLAVGGVSWLGLKKDGTVLFFEVGDKHHGKQNVKNWTNIAQPPTVKTFEELFRLEVVRAEENKKKLEQEKLAKSLEKEKRLVKEKEAQEKEAQKKAELRAEYMRQGLCQNCGGKFKGFFTKVCTHCGQIKDY